MVGSRSDRRRFVADGLKDFFEEHRPDHSRTISDDQVEGLILKTLKDKSIDATALVDAIRWPRPRA